MASNILVEEPITVNKMLSGEGFTFTTTFNEDDYNEINDSESDDTEELSGQIENVNLEDEPLYEYLQIPFNELALEMTNVDEYGMVKKRIFREGIDELIPQDSKVTYHYKAFQELEPQPFDSTYNRKKPETSRINYVLYGLGVALKSMKLREKAQFLIKPEWAYGVRGIPPRIPAEATILFEVEIVNFVPITDNDQDDGEVDYKDFKSCYAKAVKLCAEANNFVQVEKKEKPAIRSYNQAVNILSKCVMKDDKDEEDYVMLMIKLHKNLAITHNRLGHWAKVCIKCKDIYQLSNTFYRTVEPKVYYNHAKALYGLKDYQRAKDVLQKAARSTHANMTTDKNIVNLYKKIQDALEEAAKIEKTLAQAMFKS